MKRSSTTQSLPRVSTASRTTVDRNLIGIKGLVKKSADVGSLFAPRLAELCTSPFLLMPVQISSASPDIVSATAGSCIKQVHAECKHASTSSSHLLCSPEDYVWNSKRFGRVSQQNLHRGHCLRYKGNWTPSAQGLINTDCTERLGREGPEMLTLFQLPLVAEEAPFHSVLPALPCADAWRHGLQKHLQVSTGMLRTPFR